MKTETKEQKKLVEDKEFDKDKKRAEKLMNAFADLQKEKAELEIERDGLITPIKEKFEKLIGPINTSLKEAEEELKEIGLRNKGRFVKNRLPLERGYLLLSVKTAVKTGKEFVMSKFMKMFPTLVTSDFNLKQMKETFTDGDARKKVQKHFEIDLVPVETIQVKVEKEVVEE